MVRALIVDDEEDMRLLVRITLALDERCEVVGEAADGAQGLLEWERSRPDVIVLDMRMPGESGLEVARRILDLEPTQPIVMCSAYMDQHDRDEASRLGVAAVVDKNNILELPAVVCAAAAAG